MVFDAGMRDIDWPMAPLGIGLGDRPPNNKKKFLHLCLKSRCSWNNILHWETRFIKIAKSIWNNSHLYLHVFFLIHYPPSPSPSQQPSPHLTWHTREQSSDSGSEDQSLETSSSLLWGPRQDSWRSPFSTCNVHERNFRIRLTALFISFTVYPVPYSCSEPGSPVTMSRSQPPSGPRRK